jgi:Protein of unknown function (DUF998)
MSTMSETTERRSTTITIDRARVGRVAGLAAGPLFLALVAILTVAERGMLHHYGWTYLASNEVPWPSGLSTGRYGALQIANFAVTGGLLLLFTRGLAPHLRRLAGRVAVVLLSVQGVALALSSFRADHQMMLGHNPGTWNGYVHDIAFVFVAVPSLLAPIAVGLALRHDPAWRPLAKLSLIAPLLMLGAFASQSAVGDLGFTFFLVVVFGWVALLARRLGR